MSRIKILSSSSPLRVRKTLFEELITDVLRHDRYRIDRILGISESTMQIDIQGQYIPSGLPFYAECRCYDRAISAPELQAFYGKYMARWHKNKRCHGIFIALPCLDNPAKAFFTEHIQENHNVTGYLYEENDVLESLSAIYGIVSPDTFQRPISQNIGKPGDHFLLYTEKGIFWAQSIFSHGSSIPDRVALFNINGTPLSDQSILDYLTKLYPAFGQLENISIGGVAHPQPGLFHGTDEIVEVSGGSGLFEYHLPASPEGFIGRKALLADFDSFVDDVIHKKTSHRSLLLEAPSGWGKSSLVTACADRLNALGHAAIAVDSRTASSAKFIVRVFDHALRKLEHPDSPFKKAYSTKGLQGFDASVAAIQNMGKRLEPHHRLMVIFFDQFENIFFIPDLLQGVRDLFLNVCSAQTNVVLCFSWNTGLFGPASGPSTDVHHLISETSKHITLNPFSQDDIIELFDMLGDELDKTIDKNLQSSLAKLSQGYPWLLKRLFAHAKARIQAGDLTSDGLTRIPDVEDLFNEDLEGLTVQEKDALFYIAKSAPVSIFEVDKSFEHQVVQNLMTRKLVIKIGGVCDVYSDIFRNYLIIGALPLVENYLFRTQVTDVLNAVKILEEKGGSLNRSTFSTKMGLPEKSLAEITKEMNVLGLTKTFNGNITLQIKKTRPSGEIETAFQYHLKDRLRNNRPVQLILSKVKKQKTLTLGEVSEVLETSSPHISATKAAWAKYARTLARWVDIADVALFDTRKRELVYLNPETDIRERNLLLPKRRGSRTPWIQYAHVQQVATRLVQALHGDGIVDWFGIGKRSIFRSLAALEDLGFIIRRTSVIKVLPKGVEFVVNPDKRTILFAEHALKIPSFAIFIDILNVHQDKDNTLLKLGLELRDRLGAGWKKSTAEVVAKILLDWARHAKLAPGVFAETRKGPIKGWKKKEDGQLTLF
ncbi:MAG: restriction endonuclease [Desulfobacterales bacterium]|nr:MAG: restriction endonuclease [Desulfobacterales bacterium]